MIAAFVVLTGWEWSFGLLIFFVSLIFLLALSVASAVLLVAADAGPSPEFDREDL